MGLEIVIVLEKVLSVFLEVRGEGGEDVGGEGWGALAGLEGGEVGFDFVGYCGWRDGALGVEELVEGIVGGGAGGVDGGGGGGGGDWALAVVEVLGCDGEGEEEGEEEGWVIHVHVFGRGEEVLSCGY